MGVKEWVTFIKESRDWCMSKCCLIDYCLIERYDDDDDDDDNNDSIDKIKAMNLLWCINKFWSINYHLIEKCDNDDDDSIDKAETMSLLRRLYDESMRTLLISWISAWYYIQEIKNDCVYYIERIIEKKDCSWFYRNIFNVDKLY